MVYAYDKPLDMSNTGKVTAVPRYRHKKILAFSPHSDDISISAGGFISVLAADNAVIPVLGFTGWRGVSAGLNREQAINIREQEMKAEAKSLGMFDPIFLRLLSYEDDQPDAREQDEQVIKQVLIEHRPDIVLLPGRNDTQPRHRLLTEFILSALAAANINPTLFYYETPWSMLKPQDINFIVSLSQENVADKIKAISVHVSQLARTDFVTIAKSMLALRAAVIPEQLIGGYGSAINLGSWLEVFQYDRLKLS